MLLTAACVAGSGLLALGQEQSPANAPPRKSASIRIEYQSPEVDVFSSGEVDAIDPKPKTERPRTDAATPAPVTSSRKLWSSRPGTLDWSRGRASIRPELQADASPSPSEDSQTPTPVAAPTDSVAVPDADRANSDADNEVAEENATESPLDSPSLSEDLQTGIPSLDAQPTPALAKATKPLADAFRINQDPEQQGLAATRDETPDFDSVAPNPLRGYLDIAKQDNRLRTVEHQATLLEPDTELQPRPSFGEPVLVAATEAAPAESTPMENTHKAGHQTQRYEALLHLIHIVGFQMPNEPDCAPTDADNAFAEQPLTESSPGREFQRPAPSNDAGAGEMENVVGEPTLARQSDRGGAFLIPQSDVPLAAETAQDEASIAEDEIAGTLDTEPMSDEFGTADSVPASIPSSLASELPAEFGNSGSQLRSVLIDRRETSSPAPREEEGQSAETFDFGFGSSPEPTPDEMPLREEDSNTRSNTVTESGTAESDLEIEGNADSDQIQEASGPPTEALPSTPTPAARPGGENEANNAQPAEEDCETEPLQPEAKAEPLAEMAPAARPSLLSVPSPIEITENSTQAGTEPTAARPAEAANEEKPTSAMFPTWKPHGAESTSPPATADPIHNVLDAGSDLCLRVDERESRLLRTQFEVARAESLDTAVCDVIQFAPNEVAIIGKQRGVTRVEFWQDDKHETRVSYEVAVGPDGEERERLSGEYTKLHKLIKQLYPDCAVRLKPGNDRLVVSGTAKNTDQALSIISMIRSMRSIPVVDNLTVAER